jgi:hypothetical protein
MGAFFTEIPNFCIPHCDYPEIEATREDETFFSKDCHFRCVCFYKNLKNLYRLLRNTYLARDLKTGKKRKMAFMA